MDTKGGHEVISGPPENARWGCAGYRYFEYHNPAAIRDVITDQSDIDVNSITVWLKNQHDAVHSMFDRDLYPSAYVSTGDALDSYSSVLESNYVESLVELDQIMSLIPDLRPIQRLIEEVGVGRIISGAIRFVDIFTNLVLLTEFGLKPLANDLYQIAVHLDDLVERISRIGSRLDLRGKHTFTDFPSGDPLEGCTMVTRSKLVLTIPRSSALAALIGFEMAGFAPTFATIWDLIPFSFVVDWFLNISDRIAMGEQHLHFLSADIAYCVHSHTIYKPLVSNLEGITFSHDTHLKYYHRTTSRYLPRPGRSRYDFLTAKGPPVLAGGSLLWTIFRR
jgi:hypothetical protein